MLKGLNVKLKIFLVILILFSANSEASARPSAISKAESLIEKTYNYFYNSKRALEYVQSGEVAGERYQRRFIRADGGDYLLTNSGDALGLGFYKDSIYLSKEYLGEREPFKTIFKTGKYSYEFFRFNNGYYNFFFNGKSARFEYSSFTEYLNYNYATRFYKYKGKGVKASYLGVNKIVLELPNLYLKVTLSFNKDNLIEAVKAEYTKNSSIKISEIIKYDNVDFKDTFTRSYDLREYVKGSEYNKIYMDKLIEYNLRGVSNIVGTDKYSRERLVKAFKNIENLYKNSNTYSTDKGFYLKGDAIGLDFVGVGGEVYSGCMEYKKGNFYYKFSRC